MSFSTFVSSSQLSTLLSNNATIGFAYAGDKFVGSVYFGTNNNQLYSTDLTGGGIQKFGYAAAYPANIQKADASQFTSFLGDAVITSETGHQVWDVHYNGSTFVVTQIGTFPAQPEDGIFVTADIIRQPVPEPQTYALMLAGLGVLGVVARRKRVLER